MTRDASPRTIRCCFAWVCSCGAQILRQRFARCQRNNSPCSVQGGADEPGKACSDARTVGAGGGERAGGAQGKRYLCRNRGQPRGAPAERASGGNLRGFAQAPGWLTESRLNPLARQRGVERKLERAEPPPRIRPASRPDNEESPAEPPPNRAAARACPRRHPVPPASGHEPVQGRPPKLGAVSCATRAACAPAPRATPPSLVRRGIPPPEPSTPPNRTPGLPPARCQTRDQEPLTREPQNSSRNEAPRPQNPQNRLPDPRGEPKSDYS